MTAIQIVKDVFEELGSSLTKMISYSSEKGTLTIKGAPSTSVVEFDSDYNQSEHRKRVNRPGNH